MNLWGRHFILLICLITFSTLCYAKHKHKVHTSHFAHKTHKAMQTVKNSSTPAAINSQAELTQTLNRIITEADPNLQIGVQVKSMQTGDILYTRNHHRLFVPASTLKILTAEAGLLYLGPQFKFHTRFLTDARYVTNGTLDGNLYLVHSGDPTFTQNDLIDLITDLKSKQITTIKGNVYIDNSAYDQINFGPGWLYKDKQYCYGAPINASIINHNCAGFKTTSSTTNALIQYNKALILELFNRLGIRIQGNIEASVAPPNLLVVADHESKPLHVLITEMLKRSDNVIAGSLFKKIGEVYTQRPGSWESGSNAVKQILTQTAGVNTSGISVLDGSGLSRFNMITPAQLMQVLNFAYHHATTNYNFISALPIAGIDGTLKRRMHNIAWKVRAKTGTMSDAGVVSLAGYAVSKNKEPLAFVILVNGRIGMGWRYKEIEDKIVTALTRYARGK